MHYLIDLSVIVLHLSVASWDETLTMATLLSLLAGGCSLFSGFQKGVLRNAELSEEEKAAHVARFCDLAEAKPMLLSEPCANSCRPFVIASYSF